MQKHAILFVVTLVVFALPVTAQNLVTNPMFDDDVEGWDSIGGDLNHHVAEGASAPGAAYVLGQSEDDLLGGITQCIEVAPDDPLLVEAWAKALGFTPARFIVMLDSYEADGCQADSLLRSDIATLESPGTGEWRLVEEVVPPPPPGATSLRVTAAIQSQFPNFLALNLFDDIYVGPVPPLFVDGFESGDASNWSLVVP